ncbi:MAG: hypothetical protein IPJ01_11595 [Micavibrio sp.]|nr:hypothetical protein [Micavibrio sp.]
MISEDSYFIRLKDQEDVYVHPVDVYAKIEEKNKEEDTFLIKEGVQGAGIWSKSNAERFIKESEADNLEIVSVRSVLSEDGSFN